MERTAIQHLSILEIVFYVLSLMFHSKFFIVS